MPFRYTFQDQEDGANSKIDQDQVYLTVTKEDKGQQRRQSSQCKGLRSTASADEREGTPPRASLALCNKKLSSSGRKAAHGIHCKGICFPLPSSCTAEFSLR